MADEKDLKFCLDASVIVKFFIKEKDSDQAAKLLEKIFKERIEVIEPSFCKVEIYSVLRKKSSLKELTKTQVKTALNFFEKLKLDYAPEDKKILEASFKLAERLKETVIYDCLYLTLAQKERAIFITADKRFFKKAKLVYKASFLLGQAKVPIQKAIMM